jgi:hypothetical protein
MLLFTNNPKSVPLGTASAATSPTLTTHFFYMQLETFDFLMPDELFGGKA